jgi:hypothetical protein
MIDRFKLAGIVALIFICGGVRAEDKSLSTESAPTNAVFRDDMSKVILCVDHENGTAGAGVVSEGPAAKDAFCISDEKARSGKFSLRTKVALSEDYFSHGNYRSETSTMTLLPTRYNEGDVFRYRFSFMFQDDWQYDTRDCVDIIWQFKRFEGGPDMFIAAKGTDIVLRCLKSGQYTLFQNYKPGEWMDLCVIVRWSAGTNGLCEIWGKRAVEAEFKKVASFEGPNARDSKPNSTYLKWGIYKPGMDKATTTTKPRIIYQDDIIIEKMTASEK